jgi:catechol 2,3-dioxygenase-like lactoylglutathione lyase family enzyme
MAAMTYDRREQDLGNILLLEHVNVRVPDQQAATLFYIAGLGLTRDPYLMVSVENMWANAGQTQFHLPTGKPNVVQGHVELIVPDLDALTRRLASVRQALAGTQFAYEVRDKHVAVTCPWGNQFRCVGPAPEYGDMTLGISRVEVPVARGAAAGIASFYKTALKATAAVSQDDAGQAARISVGNRQEMVFRETDATIAPYDGHHVAVYISDFSGPHAWLVEHGLLTEESNPYQYRFQVIADPESGRRLSEIEHEVRCATHPMYMRPLINRNAAQRQATYVRGRDAFVPGLL